MSVGEGLSSKQPMVSENIFESDSGVLEPLENHVICDLTGLESGRMLVAAAEVRNLDGAFPRCMSTRAAVDDLNFRGVKVPGQHVSSRIGLVRVPAPSGRCAGAQACESEHYGNGGAHDAWF